MNMDAIDNLSALAAMIDDGIPSLVKGEARGGKYYRRVATGNPKRPWRYYYTREEYERDHGAPQHLSGREEAQRTREQRGGEVKLTKKQLLHALKHGTYSVISAGRNPNHPDEGKLPADHPSFEIRHQRLRRQLQFRGFKFTEVEGHYGGKEKSFIVFHDDAKPKKGGEKALMVHHDSPSEFAAIRKIGAQYNQDSVIHSHEGKHEMHFTTGEHAGEFHKGSGHALVPDAEDYYTTASTPRGATKFTLNFDWDARHEKEKAMLKAGDAIEGLGRLAKSEGGFHKYKSKHMGPGGWEYEYEEPGGGSVKKHPVDHFHETMRSLHSGAATKDKTPHPNAVVHALRGVIDHASTLPTQKAKNELAKQLDRHLDAARTHVTNMRNYVQRDRSGEHYRSPKDEARRVTQADANDAIRVRDHLDQAKGLIKEAGKSAEQKAATKEKAAARSEANSKKYAAKKEEGERGASRARADWLRSEHEKAQEAYEKDKERRPSGTPRSVHEAHGVEIANAHERYRRHLESHKQKYGALPAGHAMPAQHERYRQAIAEQKQGQQRFAYSRRMNMDPIDALGALSKAAGAGDARGGKYITRTYRGGRWRYTYPDFGKPNPSASMTHSAKAWEATEKTPTKTGSRATEQEHLDAASAHREAAHHHSDGGRIKSRSAEQHLRQAKKHEKFAISRAGSVSPIGANWGDSKVISAHLGSEAKIARAMDGTSYGEDRSKPYKQAMEHITAMGDKPLTGMDWSKTPTVLRHDPKRAKEAAAYAAAHDAHDAPMVEGMHVTADNDRGLYNQKQSIHRNLINKMASGKYDPHLARKLFQYHADATAKVHAKQGDGNPSLHDRRQMAHESEQNFRAEAARGEHDDLKHKKYKKGFDAVQYEIDALSKSIHEGADTVSESIESTPSLRKAFRGLDGPNPLAKGLYKFGNLGGKSVTLPDEYLVAYLDAFIEEAVEHEMCEKQHSMDAMTMGPAPGSPADVLAQFVFNELVAYMAGNENLMRACKLVSVSRDYIADRINGMNLLKPLASHRTDHGDYLQGYMYSEEQEQGYVGKSYGPGTVLDESAMIKAVADARRVSNALDGPQVALGNDDPLSLLGDFHRAQRARVSAMYGETPTKFQRNAGEPQR